MEFLRNEHGDAKFRTRRGWTLALAVWATDYVIWPGARVSSAACTRLQRALHASPGDQRSAAQRLRDVWGEGDLHGSPKTSPHMATRGIRRLYPIPTLPTFPLPDVSAPTLGSLRHLEVQTGDCVLTVYVLVCSISSVYSCMYLLNNRLGAVIDSSSSIYVGLTPQSAVPIGTFAIRTWGCLGIVQGLAIAPAMPQRVPPGQPEPWNMYLPIYHCLFCLRGDPICKDAREGEEGYLIRAGSTHLLPLLLPTTCPLPNDSSCPVIILCSEAVPARTVEIIPSFGF